MTSGICNVYKCANSVNPVLNLFSSSTSCGCGRWWSKHWALAFDYLKEYIVVLDATNVGGFLQGNKKCLPRAVFERCYEEKEYIGRTAIKESALEEIFKAMNDNEDKDYHLLNNNCQKWIKRLLLRLPEIWQTQLVITMGSRFILSTMKFEEVKYNKELF